MSKKIISTRTGGIAVRKITKNGNSFAVCLPKEILNKKEFGLGDEYPKGRGFLNQSLSVRGLTIC